MCVNIYIYIYVCMCVNIYIYIYIYLFIYLFVCLFIYIFIFIYLYLYLHYNYSIIYSQHPTLLIKAPVFIETESDRVSLTKPGGVGLRVWGNFRKPNLLL